MTINPYEIRVESDNEERLDGSKSNHSWIELTYYLNGEDLGSDELAGWTPAHITAARVWAAGVIARTAFQLIEDLDFNRHISGCTPDITVGGHTRCHFSVSPELINPGATGDSIFASFTMPSGLIKQAVERASYLLEAINTNDRLEYDEDDELTSPALPIHPEPAATAEESA